MPNKYQEALEYFLLWINPSSEEFDYDNYLKHRKALKELVDRAMPMKVDKNTKGSFPNYDKNDTYHTTYECPKCNCTIHLDWHEQRNFCPECAVKLDWSGDDE